MLCTIYFKFRCSQYKNECPVDRGSFAGIEVLRRQGPGGGAAGDVVVLRTINVQQALADRFKSLNISGTTYQPAGSEVEEDYYGDSLSFLPDEDDYADIPNRVVEDDDDNVFTHQARVLFDGSVVFGFHDY